MAEQILLVTGANRGIGSALVAALLLRAGVTVIASVRDPGHPTTRQLEDLPKGAHSRLIIVNIDSASEKDAGRAVEHATKQHGLSHIDTLIANAGICKYFGPAAATPVQELKDHFVVNAIGPLLMFQAWWTLLQRSKNPKFVAISTGIASITSMGEVPLPATAYGCSKAALNYVTRKIHFENESLTAFSISPGWVKTDMGNAGAKVGGMQEAPVTLADSVRGILEKVDKATRSSMGGSFQSFDQTKLLW